MGTGEFALPTFKRLCELSNTTAGHQVVAVVTQPDRTGQGHHQHPHPVREMAESFQIPVYQPEKVNTAETLGQLANYAADLYVVAAYGQILPGKLLAIPRFGAINLHGSLLPKYRGAAPVQYAVWKGEQESGVTIFQIQPKLDAGPILGVVKTPLGFHETSGQYHDRLAELSVPLTLEVINQIATGTTIPVIQDQTGVSLAPKISKEAGDIIWSQTALAIHNQIRAMQPWPKAFTHWHDIHGKLQRLVIYSIELTDTPASKAPGTVEKIDQGEIFVATGDNLIKLINLQPAGKRMMSSRDFLNGTTFSTGTCFMKEQERI
jgi:methionyl-tRNA formyltransferase